MLLPGIYSEKKSQKKYKDMHTNMFVAEFAYSKILGNIQLSSTTKKTARTTGTEQIPTGATTTAMKVLQEILI